jgi:hypothetical protein
MADDKYVREVGRLEDGQGRILIVGVSYDAVTLGLGGGGIAELGMAQQEELGQLLIAAVWQAAWNRRARDADTDRLAAGAP